MKTMPSLIALLAFTVLVSLGACTKVQPTATSAEPVKAAQVASVEGITEYQLPNGLRFLLFPDQSKQQITVNITYMVGSRHEGYGEAGMAHLLEHLLLKGSDNHPDIAAEQSEHGAFANATTWFDRTDYYETFPATVDNLDWALDLESDRMVNSFVAAEDLESEMTVVRNEWESGENNPPACSWIAFFPPPICGTTTPTSPSVPDRTSKTCPWTGCEPSTASTTSRTTPCWWWPAASIRNRQRR